MVSHGKTITHETHPTLHITYLRCYDVSSFEPLSQKESIKLIERGTIIDEHTFERDDFVFEYRKSLTVLEKGNVYQCIITNNKDY